MSGKTLAAAARAARLTEADYTALENSGSSSANIDYEALARMIGLAPGKLAGIAQGWQPVVPFLSQWQELRMFTSAGDDLTVNCFLAWDPTTRAAALFDTGFDAKVILKLVASEQLRLEYIFVTHSHPDHVACLGQVRAAHPNAQIRSSSLHAPADQRNQPGATASIGALRVSCRATPGHADDGVTYVMSGWPNGVGEVAIVGDAIFAGSMGRGNDSWDLARQKVRDEILTLPASTLICPGHGPLTTVAEERAHNPFF